MEELQIFEKIYSFDSIKKNTYLYSYSSCIYEIWSNGSELQKKLATQLVSYWSEYFMSELCEDYSRTKYIENRPEYDDFKKRWCNRKSEIHILHKGILDSLKIIENQK